MKNDKVMAFRAMLVFLSFLILMIVIAWRIITIQNEGKMTFAKNTKEKIPTRTVKRYPRRGEVLDRNNIPLVTSVSLFNIHMDPTVVSEEVFNKEISALSKGLSTLFPDTPARDFEAKIRRARSQKKRYLTIKTKATNEQRRILNTLPIFNLGRNKGGLIDNEEIVLRKRPQGEMLKRTLGYRQVSEGKELLVGIEGAYNAILSGEPGEEVEQKISTSWKKTGEMLKDPIEGADIVTSFDLEIQEVAHSELLAQLKNQGAKSGCAIVMDVKTGFVRAIVNLQLNKDGNYYESYNQAIGTREVPGSTFKLATLMAALEDGKITMKDTVNANGEYDFYTLKLHDSNEYGYGKISIQRAFELSSNVISRVIHRAYRNEPQAFMDRLRRFGLLEPLGIAIQGEPIPTFHQPGSKSWSGISLPWMAIGYEFQQTPLQTLAFYNAVANNGNFLRPLFVEKFRRNGRVIRQMKPEVIHRNICSDKTLKQLQNALVGVVQRGTGSDLKSSLFQIAGKTGTAVVLNEKGKYGEEGSKVYQASFVGYFPAKEPIYSCIVVVSAPNKDFYGATVSGTVFTAIANKVYSKSLKYHKAVNENQARIAAAPISKDGYNQDLFGAFKFLNIPYSLKEYGEWARTKANGNQVELSEKKVNKNNVPNLIGLTARDAVYLIERMGMHAIIRGKGEVVSQNISAGSPAFKGGLVEIVLK